MTGPAEVVLAVVVGVLVASVACWLAVAAAVRTARHRGHDGPEAPTGRGPNGA